MQPPRRRPCRPPPQLDLGLTSPPAPAFPPVWCILPEPTQRTLTGLLTRLLIAHARGIVPQLSAQPEDDTDER